VLLGVDIGTTSICALLFDIEEGKVKAVSQVPNDSRVHFDDPTRHAWAEQNPDRIWQRACEAIRSVLAESHVAPQRVRAVGLTGQMHGVVLVDPKCRPLSNLITWQDGRCAEPIANGEETYLDRMRSIMGTEGLFRTGGDIATGYTGPTLFWLKMRGMLPREPIRACIVHDFVAARLTDGVFHTDPTDAASTGLFDLVEKEWNWEAVERLGLARDMLCPLSESGEPIGHVSSSAAKETGLVPETVVCCPLGDNQASVLGSVRDIDRSVLVNIGTGGQVVARATEFTRIAGIDTRYFPVNRLIFVGASLCAGAAYARLEAFFSQIGRDLFGVEAGPLYEKMNELAKLTPDGAEGLLCDPLFAGTRTDPSIRGVLSGISTDNLMPGALARAVLEGIARELLGYFRQMRAHSSPPEVAIGSGNGIRKNPLLARIVAETFALPVVVPEYEEEAAFGAALAAGVGIGKIGSFAEASQFVRHHPMR